jgi:two-component system chemotaxis response regulator CheB
MKKILIADDSALLRKTVCDIISSDTKEYEISTCRDGDEALATYDKIKPDMLILYMYLPKKNGIEIINTLRHKGSSCKVVLIGTEAQEDRDASMTLSGDKNLVFVARPFHVFGPGHGKFASELNEAVDMLFNGKAIAKKVAEPFQDKPANPKLTETVLDKDKTAKPSSIPEQSQLPKQSYGKKRIVAIASSTGGPQALHNFLPMLPGNLNVPVVVVQHMPKGFTVSLCERINGEANLKVKEASDGEELLPNVVYMAPGGRHMEIVERLGKSYTRVFDDPPVNSLRPCADVMFKSLAKTGFDNLVCVVLTGMGCDGTEGLQYLKKYKSIRVITQSKETCVVYGMPKSVEQNGLSNVSVPIEKVADAVRKELGV